MLFAAVVLVSNSNAQRSEVSTPPSVRIDVAFTCRWWSEAQMEGLNPNAPPPKNTEVRLTKWEYSDPVGVPHPDTVDFVVTITNSSDQTLSNLEVEVTGEWKNGRLQDAKTAAWSKPSSLKKAEHITIESRTSQTLRVPVNLKAVMDTLGKHGEWPYAFSATAAVRVAGSGSAQPLAQVSAELPIEAGD
jgi:hypothetical protein